MYSCNSWTLLGKYSRFLESINFKEHDPKTFSLIFNLESSEGFRSKLNSTLSIKIELSPFIFHCNLVCFFILSHSSQWKMTLLHSLYHLAALIPPSHGTNLSNTSTLLHNSICSSLPLRWLSIPSISGCASVPAF